MGCGKQREATAPIESLVKFEPWFLSLGVKDLPLGRTAANVPALTVKDLRWAEHSDDDDNDDAWAVRQMN